MLGWGGSGNKIKANRPAALEKRRKIEAERIRIEQQKIKDVEAKKLREDTQRLNEEELRFRLLQYLPRIRDRPSN